jgi:hypothetical protein
VILDTEQHVRKSEPRCPRQTDTAVASSDIAVFALTVSVLPSQAQGIAHRDGAVADPYIERINPDEARPHSRAAHAYGGCPERRCRSSEGSS